MKTLLLLTLKITGIVLVCLFNPLAGLTLSNQLAFNDDDDDFDL